MSSIDQLGVAGAALLLLAIVARAPPYRIGMPLLSVFLAVDMLARQDSRGGIVFNDAGIASTARSVVLAIMLLGDGLNTRSETSRAE